MAVRKKGRRKLIWNEELYVWYIELDSDSPYYILNVCSDDKNTVIACPLGMQIPYIISKGNSFQGKKTSGVWERYRLPFDVPEIITPGFVSEIIAWVTEGTGAEQLAWNGKDILL